MKKIRIKGKVTCGPDHGLREGSRVPSSIFNYLIVGGGLGDYICQMPVFEWIAATQPYVHGRIFTHSHFKDVVEYVMRDHPSWKIYLVDDLPKVHGAGEFIVNPLHFHQHQADYINPCGAHLMDVGFMFYSNYSEPPEAYRRMPDLSGYDSGVDWGLTTPYAVVNPAYTAMTRSMPAEAFHEIKNYLLSRGVTPVLLGKKNFNNNKEGSESEYYAKLRGEMDFTDCVDLREQTTLLEATEIMRDAKLVYGVDNGLLHFAGCTEVPIIFGHTVTKVEHRDIRRPKGITHHITVPPEELACTACQSNVRNIVGLDYKYCLYQDYLCTDLLFKDRAALWKRAIDDILEE